MDRPHLAVTRPLPRPVAIHAPVCNEQSCNASDELVRPASTLKAARGVRPSEQTRLGCVRNTAPPYANHLAATGGLVDTV